MRLHLSRLLAGTALAFLSLPALATDEQDGIGRFDIARFEVQGNTLLGADAIEALLRPYTGKARNFGDVQRALETLEAAYHARGYKVVQVALPEQELNQGVVTLHVVETRLGKVRVEGNSHFEADNIRRSLPRLREGVSPDIGAVSSSLKLANENPSKKVTLQLQGGSKEDEVDAVLKVADEKPWRVAVAVDNSGNPTTGKTQLTTQFQHANVADRDHVLSLQYTTTFEKPSKISVYGAGYHIPLYAWGDSIDLFASYSDVNSGSVLAGIFNLQVSGRGTVLGGRYNQNLRRVGDYESKLIYGLDYKAYRNNVSLQGAQLGSDVTVHPLSIAYAGTMAAPGSEAGFVVTAIRNVPGGDKGSSDDFNRARSGASANYSILRYNAGYSRALPSDWLARVTLSGQFTDDALVPGEQFGAGGASSVRGFTEREATNDYGHLLSAELYTPNLCSTIQDTAAQCRLLAFVDTARLRRNDSLPGETARTSIGSVGLGLRLTVARHMSLQLDAGRVVDAGALQGKGDTRLHARLGLTY